MFPRISVFKQKENVFPRMCLEAFYWILVADSNLDIHSL